MKTEKRIHNIYKDYQEAIKRGVKLSNPLGKYQYIFSNSRGKISMISELRGNKKHPAFWEIHCLEGDLFEDCERFSTKKEAIKKAKEHLGVGEFEEIIEEKLEKIKNGR